MTEIYVIDATGPTVTATPPGETLEPLAHQ